MADKYIDFDAYREEKKDEKLVIKAFGEELELPPSPKLSTMERIIELMNTEGGQSELPEEEVLNMLSNLLGKKQFETLKDNGITIEGAEWLLMQVWQQYKPQEKEDGTGNPETASTSLKNGEQ